MTTGADLDDAIAAAWPPLVVHDIGGWHARLTAGVTRRANSVRATRASVDLESVIEQAGHLYREAGLRPTFLISDASTPSEALDGLVSAGFEAVSETTVLSRPAIDPSGSAPTPEGNVVVNRDAAGSWLDSYWAVAGEGRRPSDRQLVRDVLLRPRAPSRFVSIVEHGTTSAVGQVVVVDQVACIQCLATMPDARRRGAGRRVVIASMAAAVLLGASEVCAAVAVDNDASQRLFRDLGFATSHHYRYLIGPGDPSVR